MTLGNGGLFNMKIQITATSVLASGAEFSRGDIITSGGSVTESFLQGLIGIGAAEEIKEAVSKPKKPEPVKPAPSLQQDEAQPESKLKRRKNKAILR